MYGLQEIIEMNAKPEPEPEPPYDLVGQIMAYEGGEMDEDEFLVLFSHLVASGDAWHLQGTYGRTAVSLIQSGYLSEDGEILASL